MVIAAIIVLILIIIGLMIYNILIHKKIDIYSSLSQRTASLEVLQEFMNTIGESLSVNEKLDKINDILLNKYAIKYSTIVVYDGATYKIRASNVDQKHWDVLTNLQSEPVFQDSIQTATPKYITVEKEEERLPYQKMEFGRAKCAMFFPLYIDNVYIGYWIIEDSQPHSFDKIDTTILEVVKNNIITVLKTLNNQETIENIVRDDLFSGLKSEEYLYGEGKKKIDKYTTSAVCMFKVTNLPEINETVSRKTGDQVIIEISEMIKHNIAQEYVFVRYMGPKFVIVFSGVEVDGVISFMKDIKIQIEAIEINAREDYKGESEEPIIVKPKINSIISTYYKGTHLDGLMKKLEEYLDVSQENTINSL